MVLRQFLRSDAVAVSYLIGCGGRAAAAVVDPLGDITPYSAPLTRQKVQVLEAPIDMVCYLLMEGNMDVEQVRTGAQAAGVAAYDLVQKVFLLLIERGALSVEDAQVILRDSIETQRGIMDVEWAPSTKPLPTY